MKIHSVCNNNFKGVPIADIKVKGFNACYKLYDVNAQDYDFLNKMYNSVNIKKLMPDMTQDDYVLWDMVIRHAIKLSRYTENHSILEAIDNKPCGIMSYKNLNKKYHVSYVATFPTKEKKRVPFAGQILFNELLNRFVKCDNKRIELYAIKDAPFNPISKYLKLGFHTLGGDEYSEFMRLTRARALKTLDKQSKFLVADRIKKKEFVDLNNELELDLFF